MTRLRIGHGLTVRYWDPGLAAGMCVALTPLNRLFSSFFLGGPGNLDGMRRTMYVETSILSYLTAQPSRDLRAAAWQQDLPDV